MKKEVIFLVGNVGAGKTTLAMKLAKSKTHEIINADEIGEKFGLNLKGSIENFKKCELSIKSLFINKLDCERNIVLDVNLLSTDERKYFMLLAKSKGYYTKCFDFGSGKLNQLERRIKDNPEKSIDEWTAIFQEKKQLYESPTFDEGFDEIIRF